VVKDLEERGIAFETLDGISTKGSTGKLVLSIFGAVAEFEKNLILERTLAGLRGPRARSVVVSAP
jgi:DNA invertase Pin-like site-specific DNA recombinase